MPTDLTEHLVVPVASVADARETARIVERYSYGTVTVVHVIERTDGAPDKLSPEQAEERAREAFDAFRDVIPDAEAELVYQSDVVAGIDEVAAAVDGSAIAFHPRGGSRLVQLLSGDTTLRLVTEVERPVIAIPTESTDE